ncbi:MAG: septal ring lytic transglycosylase RlpA family protein [Nitrospirota bacterium]
MKTSADTFCKKAESRRQNPEDRSQTSSFFYALPSIFCLLLLASCAATRYEVTADQKAFTPVGQPQEQTNRKERSSGFQEMKGSRRQCVASWYGPDFHGRPTSSGELFNMHALTCAHREYPFGTKLKVLNPKNNKVVECTVNDRGPFIAGRELDLSYAAARRIDLIGPGTQTVFIEPVGRDMRYAKYIRYGVLDATLTLQIGSFRDEFNAKRLKMALELKYKNVYIMEANVGGAKYYRVRLGKFNSKADAVNIGKSLADEGFNVLITKFEQQI